VEARGGSGNGDVGGSGVEAAGGAPLGKGVVATGGFGGIGLEAGGGGGSNTTRAGTGVNATGGTNTFGIGGTGGIGLVAIGGTNGNSLGRAALFGGRVEIEGDLDLAGAAGCCNLNVQGTKNFKIDHPLDPENKYLLHASIESSEVLNIYSGNIVTDANGEVVVTLPEWFEALNRDLRYQLTVIGTFAQAIVAEKVKHNRFTIRTNGPNVEVSWQVTGVRSDAVMRKHPFKAEESKPERERGTYLTPELFSKPEERGVEWVRYPEVMRQLKQQRLEAGQMPKQQKQISRSVP
jgi:trimeric autotransporter adhesin